MLPADIVKSFHLARPLQTTAIGDILSEKSLIKFLFALDRQQILLSSI
jgi:hypothetical protein